MSGLKYRMIDGMERKFGEWGAFLRKVSVAADELEAVPKRLRRFFEPVDQKVPDPPPPEPPIEDCRVEVPEEFEPPLRLRRKRK